MNVETVVAHGAVLGESPVYESDTDCILWVDIDGGVLHRTWLPSGRDDREQRVAPLSFVGLSSEGLILGEAGRVVTVERRTGRTAGFAAVCVDDVHLRLNDGQVAPDGSAFVGVMPRTPVKGHPLGYLAHITTRGAVGVVFPHVGLPNGLAWSPDGSEMFFVDSLARRIDRCLFHPEAEGAVGPRSLFVDTALYPGLPDGITMDAEGNLWVAFWQGGAVRAFAPDGRCIRTLVLPVKSPTSCAFGGAALDSLFITTAHSSGDALSGSLLAADVGARGMAARRFGAADGAKSPAPTTGPHACESAALSASEATNLRKSSTSGGNR